MSHDLSKEDSAAVQWFPVFNESDRGVVITGVALIDDELRNLIVAKMSATDHHLPGKIHKFRDNLFAPESQGCFSSLFAKYQIAYAMGWIDETTYEDIKIVAKLRNLAAHDSEHFRFENKNVIKLLRKISTIADNSEDDLLELSAMSQMHTGSDIVYHAGGVTAKVEFIQAVGMIVEVIRIEKHYAKVPPPGTMDLKRGELVRCLDRWERGMQAIVLCSDESTGMVEANLLGFVDGTAVRDPARLYFYDLERVQMPDLPDHCDLEVGDEVELAESDGAVWFSKGVVESIDTEFRTVTARSSGLLKGVFRAFWGELKKVGH
jgi:DNA-binding MltR family transcriptional regulator